MSRRGQSTDIVERIERKIQRRKRRGSKSPCWIWTGMRDKRSPRRHPLVYFGPYTTPSGKKGQRVIRVMRVLWPLHREEPMPRHVYPGECGDLRCVNPEHWTGGLPDLSAVKEIKTMSKMTDEERAALKKDLERRAFIRATLRQLKDELREYTLAAIGDRYGMTREAVRLIESGKIWKEGA